MTPLKGVKRTMLEWRGTPLMQHLGISRPSTEHAESNNFLNLNHQLRNTLEALIPNTPRVNICRSA